MHQKLKCANQFEPLLVLFILPIGQLQSKFERNGYKEYLC